MRERGEKAGTFVSAFFQTCDNHAADAASYRCQILF